METSSALDYTNYLPNNDQTENSRHVEMLRACILEIFKDCDEIQSIRVSGSLIEYTRDMVLPALGAIRRNATANARMFMSPDEIAAATALSRAVVSRLITESRGVQPK